MFANNWRLSVVMVLSAVIAGFAIAAAQPPESVNYDACDAPPLLYRLDAKYHQLPETFVRDFLDHPPMQGPFESDVVCKTANGADGPVNYCVCFGGMPCAALKASNRCSGEIGLHPSGRAGVCRVRSVERFENPCASAVERVTVG